ncbi:MAG TPA: hypothetical protein PLN21_05970 [Gemmatales bacterium]|nr:hypothetical protein [Gemmatales bacterium]
MQTICFSLPRCEQTNKGWKVSSSYEVDQQRYSIWYEVSQGPIADGVDTFLAACVVPAMKLGYAVKCPAPVSARLLEGITYIQSIMHGWYPELQQVPILAEAKTPSVERATGAASFFSCGVDAFYTMLKHRPSITHGVLIHGFDFPVSHAMTRQTVTRMAHHAAGQLDLPLIEVATNVREFADRYTDFRLQYHGSMLGSVALLLSPQLSTIYVPSTHAFADQKPLGSHPDLDHRWSSEQIDLVHDGCEAYRVEKVAKVAQSDAALSVLRVCWHTIKKQGEAYNCGRCEKCLRTMMDLRAAGALQRCPTFNRPLTLRKLKLLDMRQAAYRAYYESTLAQLQQTGLDPRLAAAIEEALSERHYRGFEGFCRDASKPLSQYLIRPVFGPVMRPLEQSVRWVKRKWRGKQVVERVDRGSSQTPRSHIDRNSASPYRATVSGHGSSR